MIIEQDLEDEPLSNEEDNANSDFKRRANRESMIKDLNREIKILQSVVEEDSQSLHSNEVSYDFNDYHTAKSYLISQQQTISITQYEDNYSDKSESEEANEESISSHTELERNTELKKHFMELNEFGKVKEIDREIILNEIDERKKKYQERLSKLKQIENKVNGNIIQSENANKIDEKDLILANIVKDDGYYIITNKELQKNFIRKEFKKFEFYVPKEVNKSK